MRRQKVDATPPKKQLKVAVPGEAPSIGAAPKRLRSSAPALSPGAGSSRDYGKTPPIISSPYSGDSDV